MKITKSIITLASLVGLLVTAPLASAQCCGAKSKVPAKKTGCCASKSGSVTVENKSTDQTKTTVLSHYVSLSNALYKDDLASAQKAADGLVKLDEKSTLAASATELSKAKTIVEARKSFNTLSAAAIEIAKKEKGYKVAHCPMANGGKGGNWLQKATDKQVNNPYYGAKMAHCGSFMK